MKLARFLLAGLALSAASPALAAVSPRPIPGYKCMMLDLTEQQSMDPSVHIQVRSGPSASAPVIGWASSVVVVKQPATPVGGYLAMLFSMAVGHGSLPTKSVRSRASVIQLPSVFPSFFQMALLVSAANEWRHRAWINHRAIRTIALVGGRSA